jgi:epoxyqueuosine reductase QueG
MSLITKIMDFMFEKVGIPEFEKIIEIEDALIEEDGVLGFSPKSATRFDIPIEASKRKGVNLFVTPRILPHILSSAKNLRKSFKDLKLNPTNPKIEISSTDLEELKKIAETEGICEIGFTKVPHELIFQKKSIIYDNAIVLVMKMDNQLINTAPSKKAIKNIWYTYDYLGRATMKIAKFLRQRGYSSQASHPLGGLVLYPRLAEKAGLGSFGKAGLLITPVNGSTVRLAAVFTSIQNLPITDGNEHSWIGEFCKTCLKCIKECPPQAILKEPIKHDTGRVTHIDNNKCFPYFAENYACTICIKVCPFNHTSYEKIKVAFEKRK